MATILDDFQPLPAVVRSIIHAISVGVVVVDRNHRVLMWNHFMEAHSGVDATSLVGKDLFEEFPGLPAEWLKRKFASVFLLGNFAFSNWLERPFVFKFRAPRSITGELEDMHQDCVFIPLHDSSGEVTAVCLTIHDATDTRSYQIRLESINEALRRESEALQRAQREISHLANHDPLTDLPNRRYFQSFMDRTIHLAQTADAPFALLTVDLDNFKRVNDSLGHATGDYVIQYAGNVLREAIRGTDYLATRTEPRSRTDGSPAVARVGGDEFVIVLPEIRRPEDAGLVAERITRRMSEPLTIDGVQLGVGASVGIAVFPQDGDDATTLIGNADAAMYAAKLAGGNRFRFYTSALNRRANERLWIESELRQAIRQDVLEPYFQAIVDTDTGAVVGAEVLARWHHEERPIRPDEFIPVAEDTGLIVELGEQILRKACRSAASWMRRYPQLDRIAVNVSPVQLRQPDFVDRVEAILSETGMPGPRLALEVTESVLLTASAENKSVLHQLKELGVKINLDDFGTGYSSLSYLIRFPIDAIKIDRCFVTDIATSDASEKIVSVVTGLATGLELGLIAEGVETREHVDCLRALGCDVMQGFLFCRPAPADAFEAWLDAFELDALIDPAGDGRGEGVRDRAPDSTRAA